MTEAVGIVLAGGRSRRMGRDKTLLELAGETLVSRAARRLAEVCREVAVADAGRGSVPGFVSLPDGPGAGPAAGILGAARAFPGRYLLVVACDLPDLAPGLLSRLAQGADADWLLPRWTGGLEPLCAVYGPVVLSHLEARVVQGEMALHALTETSSVRIRYLDEGELCPYGDPAVMFHNLNRPEDLSRREASFGAEVIG